MLSCWKGLRASLSSRFWITLLALGAFAGGVAAQDEDGTESDVSSAPASPLRFQFEALRMFAQPDGPKSGKVFWYMLYTIENRSEKPVDLFLSVNAKGDRKDNYSDLYLPTVESAIERKLGRKLWGQTDRYQILAERDPKDENYNYVTLEPGEKRRSVAVFNAFDPAAREISIEVHGLDEKLEVERAPDLSLKVRERVRILKFERRGDEYGFDQDSFRLVDRGWIKQETALASE